MTTESIKAAIRTIPDFPKPGINFRDITTLFEQPELHRTVFRQSLDWAGERGFEAVAGIDARGFIFAGGLAERLGVPLVLIRKKGKLPGDLISRSYNLEYGTATVEVHQTAVLQGRKVLIVDDLLATGGTALASVALVRELGAASVAFTAIINLSDLPGAGRLTAEGVDCYFNCEFSEHE